MASRTGGLPATIAKLRERLARRTPYALLHSFAGRVTLGELSGSLGDLGLFLPLFLGMHRAGKIAAVPALFWAGAFNVLTGLAWDVPMCVQPMKTIAAAAINGELSAAEVTASGMLVSLLVSALALSGGLELVHRLLPAPLVRGIQLGFGLRLVQSAAGMLLPADAGWGIGYSSKGLGLLGGLGLLLLLQHERMPAALLLTAIGLLLALARALEEGEPLPFTPGVPVYLSAHDVAWADVASGLWRGALPQLPLTTLNSVIAVAQLAHDLKPSVKVGRTAVALSLGLLNLAGCPLGGMPMCHGAGGLAGQWRFGARGGVSVILLGLAKMGIALVGGASFVALLDRFPTPLLGAMLVFSGIELASAGLRGVYTAPPAASAADVRAARDAALLCLGTGGFVVAMGTGAGAIAGCAIAVVHRLRDLTEARVGCWRAERAAARPHEGEPGSEGSREPPAGAPLSPRLSSGDDGASSDEQRAPGGREGALQV